MANSTLQFKINDGQLILQNTKCIIDEVKSATSSSTAYIFDIPSIKRSIKQSTKGKAMSVAPFLVLGVGAGTTDGVFWQVFMQYIFPWLTDIAKVYCAIRIAQAFYQEKRGGRDEGTGFSAFVTYGKWLLLFHILPFGVELIDQIGEKMWIDLKNDHINISQ